MFASYTLFVSIARIRFSCQDSACVHNCLCERIFLCGRSFSIFSSVNISFAPLNVQEKRLVLIYQMYDKENNQIHVHSCKITRHWLKIAALKKKKILAVCINHKIAAACHTMLIKSLQESSTRITY